MAQKATIFTTSSSILKTATCSCESESAGAFAITECCMRMRPYLEQDALHINAEPF